MGGGITLNYKYELERPLIIGFGLYLLKLKEAHHLGAEYPPVQWEVRGSSPRNVLKSVVLATCFKPFLGS